MIILNFNFYLQKAIIAQSAYPIPIKDLFRKYSSDDSGINYQTHLILATDSIYQYLIQQLTISTVRKFHLGHQRLPRFLAVSSLSNTLSFPLKISKFMIFYFPHPFSFFHYWTILRNINSSLLFSSLISNIVTHILTLITGEIAHDSNFFNSLLFRNSIMFVLSPIRVITFRLLQQIVCQREDFDGFLDCWIKTIKQEGLYSLYKKSLLSIIYPPLKYYISKYTQFLSFNIFMFFDSKFGKVGGKIATFAYIIGVSALTTLLSNRMNIFIQKHVYPHIMS